MNDTTGRPDLISLASEIVSAFVANNSIKSQEVANLIRETHGALAALGAPQAAEAAAEPVFTPAVGVRKSLASRDHILSLIDGKPYKTLKRHLSRHGLTPVQYRERYGLPKTYPMVAPAYSEARSEVAKKLGLGQRARAARAEAGAAAPAKPAGKKRGRPAKAASA